MIFIYDSESNLIDPEQIGLASNPLPCEFESLARERCRLYETRTSRRLTIKVEADRPHRAQRPADSQTEIGSPPIRRELDPRIEDRARRSQIFAQIDLVLNQHRRELESVAIGILQEPTLSDSEYKRVLTFAKDLVSLSDGEDSGPWEWPEPPAGLFVVSPPKQSQK